MQTVLWIVGVYLLVCLGGRVLFPWFMYFPDPARVPPAAAGLAGIEERELTTPDGEALVLWYGQAKPGQPTVIYFHGNGANAANRASKIETMRASGFGVLYLNNRGYGGSTGKPSERHNVADALIAYDYLIGLGIGAADIVLYGESLGSGQAIPLAARRPVRAVVLEAPLTSTPEVGRRTWWFLPLGLILSDQYDNERHISAVKAPVLVLHGQRDEIIPVEMGKRVFAAASEPKRFELIPEASHNDMFDHGAWQRVEAFLAGLAKN